MGTGIVDWKDFFEAAKVGGLQYIFVEMESDPTIMEGCAKYVKAFKRGFQQRRKALRLCVKPYFAGVITILRYSTGP